MTAPLYVVDVPQVSDPALEEGDPIHSHIVWAKDGKSASAVITEARVFGLPLEALCGHVWVPSRDPERHPLCSKCEAIRDQRLAGMGGSN